MAGIRECERHGYFEDGACSDCGRPGTRVLDDERRKRLSKYVSGALRHFPVDAGVDLDERGWTRYDELLDSVQRKYEWADRTHLDALVATDPKGRFEREERDGRVVVRAAYGHSVDVDLEPTDGPVPDVLYHGTAPDNVASIRADGLEPMSRQHVHLSESIDTALSVGRRHASTPILFEVDAAGLQTDGHRIAKRGRETYTTEHVPPEYLTLLDP